MIKLVPLSLIGIAHRSLKKEDWKAGYSDLRLRSKNGDQLATKLLVAVFSPVPEYEWCSFSRWARWQMRGAW